MFFAQVVATIVAIFLGVRQDSHSCRILVQVAGTVQLGVQAWMFTNIPDLCDPHQKNGFIVSTYHPVSRSNSIP